MSAISWFRLPRGRVWHVALGARGLCGERLPVRGGEWQPNLPPMRARVCSECVDADLRLRDNISQALDRRDVPLPMGDDQVVDAEIVDDGDGWHGNSSVVIVEGEPVVIGGEARLISFGPSTGESVFPFAGVSVISGEPVGAFPIVNGTVTGEITVDDVDGKLAAAIADIDQGGTLEAGFDPDGDEIVYDPDGDPDRSAEHGPSVADLADQLRAARAEP